MSVSTLKNLRARVREEADMEDSDFVENNADGLDRRINAAGKKLYSMVANGGGVQWALQQPVVMVAGQEAYVLTSPAKKVHAVEFVDEPISDFGFIERNVRRGSTKQPRFRLEGALNIRLMPAPTQDGPNVRVWYFPIWVDLVAETDGAEVWEWEEFIVLDAAIGCARKEESTNLGDMERERAFLIETIMADVGEKYSGPDHIIDTGSYDSGAFDCEDC